MYIDINTFIGSWRREYICTWFWLCAIFFFFQGLQSKKEAYPEGCIGNWRVKWFLSLLCIFRNLVLQNIKWCLYMLIKESILIKYGIYIKMFTVVHLSKFWIKKKSMKAWKRYLKCALTATQSISSAWKINLLKLKAEILTIRL